jgi:DNA-binding transcriptional MerR regulator
MNKKNMTAIVVAVVLIAGYFGAKMYASNRAEAKVDEAIAKAGNVADIEYKKVTVDLFGMDVRIVDLLVSPAKAKEKIKIAEIVIHDIDRTSDIPTFLSMTCNGIELNMQELGEHAKPIKELGYTDNVMVNLNADYHYDHEKKELNLKKLGLGADDAGEISISFRIGNINLQTKQIAALLFTFPQMIFNEAKLSFQDDSLTDRLMSRRAKQKGVNLEEFKQALIQEVEKEIDKERDQFTREALSEMKKFIEDPEELTISAFPSKPQPISHIMSAGDLKDLIKLLNIQIRS